MLNDPLRIGKNWNSANFFYCLLASGLIYERSKKHNKELWGNNFEGVTHKPVNLKTMAEPELFIEKRARKSGQGDDHDKNELLKPQQNNLPTQMHLSKT